MLIGSFDVLKFDCSDASFGYPGGPILFKNLNFGIDLDSRIASKDVQFLRVSVFHHAEKQKSILDLLYLSIFLWEIWK